MEERLRRSVAEIVEFLRSFCGLRDLRLDRELFTVEFDTTLVGADPLTIVVLEHKSNTSERSLSQSIRKIQSFAWSLQANHKLALINFILVVPQALSAGALNSFEAALSGTARVFVIAETMNMKEVEGRLSLIGDPVFATNNAMGAIAGTLDMMLAGGNAELFVAMTHNSSSEEDLITRIINEFEAVIAEVDRAIDEP